MAKIKKIREIKSKIKIIREIERNEGEEELVEDIEKAEDDFRREVAVSSGIEASSLVLESDIKESRGAEKTQIREETRERVQLERENETTAATYGARRAGAEERSYRQYKGSDRGSMQNTGQGDSMLVQNRGTGRQANPQMGATNRGMPLVRQDVGQLNEIERVEEKREYETQKDKKRTYPWER